MEPGIVALAAGELCGDKLRSAPDRIVSVGMIACVITADTCGAALAPRRRARLGAVLGALNAVASVYSTFAIRRRAMRRFGQMRSGLVEDGLTVAPAKLAVRVA